MIATIYNYQHTSCFQTPGTEIKNDHFLKLPKASINHSERPHIKLLDIC